MHRQKALSKLHIFSSGGVRNKMLFSLQIYINIEEDIVGRLRMENCSKCQSDELSALPHHLCICVRVNPRTPNTGRRLECDKEYSETHYDVHH